MLVISVWKIRVLHENKENSENNDERENNEDKNIPGSCAKTNVSAQFPKQET